MQRVFFQVLKVKSGSITSVPPWSLTLVLPIIYVHGLYLSDTESGSSSMTWLDPRPSVLQLWWLARFGSGNQLPPQQRPRLPAKNGTWYKALDISSVYEESKVSFFHHILSLVLLKAILWILHNQGCKCFCQKSTIVCSLWRWLRRRSSNSFYPSCRRCGGMQKTWIP